MNSNKYPYKGTNLVGTSNIFIAEYNALRRELEIFIEHQKEIMNFSILTFTAMVGLYGFIIGNKNSFGDLQSVSYVFLLFPWIFFLLTLLYADKTIRILRVADYLQNHLRVRIKKICGENFWQWELYKMHESFPLSVRKIALGFDKARWLIFYLPSIFSIMLFFSLPFAANLKLIAYFSVTIFSFEVISPISPLISPLEETMGVGPRENVVDLDEYEKDKIEKSIARAIVDNFKKIPDDEIIKLSKEERAAGAVANAIVRYFTDLSYNVQDLLSELSMRDETAGAVARAIEENFDKLPQNVREDLLLKLSEKERAAGSVADIVSTNFDKLPEGVRNELLLKLSEKDEVEKFLDKIRKKISQIRKIVIV